LQACKQSTSLILKHIKLSTKTAIYLHVPGLSWLEMKCIFLSARNVCNLQHKLPTQNVSKEILTGFSSQSKRPTLSVAVLHLKVP